MRLHLVTLCALGLLGVSLDAGTPGDRLASEKGPRSPRDKTGIVTSGPTPPNVLILLADDVGVDNIGVYAEGADLPATPNIDGLAASGVLFRNAYSHPVCSPTRAALLTGRYAFRNRIGFVVMPTGGALRDEELTLPEMTDASPHGYSNAAFGKWHLSNDGSGGLLAPNLAGFDHFSGTECSLITPETYTDWTHITNGVAVNETDYEPEVIVDEAIAWMNARTEPFVCYLPFNLPHSPYHRPPDILHNTDFTGVDPDPLVEPRPYYKSMVEAMDTLIGRILTQLDPLTLSNTIIVFTGDNGTPQSTTAAPFIPTRAKTTVFEGGVNVPFIVSGPPVALPGTESAALVHTVDIFATVAEATGVDLETLAPSTTFDSVSLYPYLQNPATPSIRTALFTETFYPNGRPPTGPVPYLCVPAATGPLSGPYESRSDRGIELICQPNVGFEGPGTAELRICGPILHEPSVATLLLTGGPPNANVLMLWGNAVDPTPFATGVLVPKAEPYGGFYMVTTDATGRYTEQIPHALGFESLYYQAAITDLSQPGGYSISNVVRSRSFFHAGAIRDTQYKLIYDAYTCDESFFDLNADPFELVDLLQGSLTTGEQTAYDALKSEITALTGY